MRRRYGVVPSLGPWELLMLAFELGDLQREGVFGGACDLSVDSTCGDDVVALVDSLAHLLLLLLLLLLRPEDQQIDDADDHDHRKERCFE